MIFPTLIMKVERWKFNKEYGVYVSTEGHFKDRYKRYIPFKVNRAGYLAIKTEVGLVLSHRLVMLTWRPCPNASALTVDHLNHNKRDNSLSNLEWVTKKENLRRASEDQAIDEATINKRKEKAERMAAGFGDFYFFVNGIQCDTLEDVCWYLNSTYGHKLGCVVTPKMVNARYQTLLNMYKIKDEKFQDGKKSFNVALFQLVPKEREDY